MQAGVVGRERRFGEVVEIVGGEHWWSVVYRVWGRGGLVSMELLEWWGWVLVAQGLCSSGWRRSFV